MMCSSRVPLVLTVLLLLLSVAPTTALSESTLWMLRAVSATSGYVGMVAFLDRPRGELGCDSGQVLQIRPSTVPGAGLGLFATAPLPRGMRLGTYPGTVLPLQQNLSKLRQYPACEGYIWRFSDNRAVIDPTNARGCLDDVVVGGNPSLPGSVWMFENFFGKFRTVPTTLCRINEPPKGMDVNVITEEDLDKRVVVFRLERDVCRGEELFIDYGLSYDRSMYGGGGGGTTTTL